MATVPPRPSATPTGTPISIRTMKTPNRMAAIMRAPKDAAHHAQHAQRDGGGHHRQPDRIPPGRHADGGRGLFVDVLVGHQLDRQHRQQHEEQQHAAVGDQGHDALASRRAVVGQDLDADVVVAHEGHAAAGHGQHDQQEDGDFLGPGEGLVGEIAHQHVHEGDQRQRRQQDHGQPVLDGQRHFHVGVGFNGKNRFGGLWAGVGAGHCEALRLARR